MLYIMSNFKILVPLDGSEKSMDSIDWVTKYYKKEDVDVTLLYVAQVIYTSELEMISVVSELDVANSMGKRLLDEAAGKLSGYRVNKLVLHGAIADSILREATDGNYDLIIMTKSSVKGLSRIFGSIVTKVVRDAEVAVVVVPD